MSNIEPKKKKSFYFNERLQFVYINIMYEKEGSKRLLTLLDFISGSLKKKTTNMQPIV